jgi:mercuric ion transport protein
MNDRKLIATGIIGGVIAAICCAAPLLVISFGTVGLTAWLGTSGYVVVPLVAAVVGLIGFVVYKRYSPQRDRSGGNTQSHRSAP